MGDNRHIDVSLTLKYKEEKKHSVIYAGKTKPEDGDNVSFYIPKSLFEGDIAYPGQVTVNIKS